LVDTLYQFFRPELAIGKIPAVMGPEMPVDLALESLSCGGVEPINMIFLRIIEYFCVSDCDRMNRFQTSEKLCLIQIIIRVCIVSSDL